ncbi:tRNA glutamyl-Q(34) synthetase GluQRS [bacterium]|nr:tRNA glutamyl-Q(34) synthetase GluQRS [bacterium]
MSFRTRFAPSPTGPLHLGHAYSALLAHDMAMADGGEFLLRIEDIDQSRCRPEWEDLIYQDLKWLGLSWEEPVLRQSDRMDAYRAKLKGLWNDHVIFACGCNRRDVLEAASAPQDGTPAYGPDGIVYPGTCNLAENKTNWYETPMPEGTAFRLDMAHVAEHFMPHRIDSPDGGGLFGSFIETGAGPNGETGLIEFTASQMETEVGDVVLARRDMGTSYHLSVVLDDAVQGITHVVRGADLFETTKIHVILQHMFGLPTPIYHHHRLICDENGKRLAKRDDAKAIRKFREEGATPDDIRRMVGL